MTDALTLDTALPRRQPTGAAPRLLLFGIRRTGAHGLNDAAAASAFVYAFGTHFRRPLVLLRSLMAEMSAASSRPITIAPCCCPRMTADEAMLIDLLVHAAANPARATLLMADLIGRSNAGGPAATACLLSQSFADTGKPLS